MNKPFLFLTLVGCLGAAAASAQPTVRPLKKEFLDSTFAVLSSDVGARYRRETEYTDSVGGTIRDYYLSGQLQSSGAFEHLRREIPNGVVEFWYPSGQLQCHSEFAHGQPTGDYRLYFPNGQLKRRETYAAGQPLPTSGNCFAADGQPVPYFAYQQLPVYPAGDGGNGAIVAAVARNVSYPKDAAQANRAGRVLVSFIVNKRGEVTNIQIKEGVFPSIDAEVVRAVQKLKRFTPGQQDGEPVAVSFTIPVTFKLAEPRSFREKLAAETIPSETPTE